ncbi:MAG: PqqD family peptide modification chaperone [Solirubrobacteraceae bacterium]
MIDPDQRLRLRSSAVMWREVDGEVLALVLDHSEYVAANRSATALWRMLEHGATSRALAGALSQRWGLDPDRALVDAQGFVGELDQQGLLERVA